MNLEGKKVILTGASSGIGLEMLSLLAKYDRIEIVAVARHVESVLTIDGVVYPFAADVSTAEGIDRVFEYANQMMGGVDLFIANAGIAYLEEIGKPDWSHTGYIYNLNVFSPIYSLQKLVAESGDREIAFACTISGAGLVSLPAYSLYCSTKAALHHFVQTYRYEQPERLQLTAIYPVATRTEFFDKATGERNTPLPFPIQDADVVARKIVKGIEKNKKTIYPSPMFRLFYPVGRAFPCLLRVYSLMEKKKVKKWLRF